jgi:heme-degrading monooxygenase HmoA
MKRESLLQGDHNEMIVSFFHVTVPAERAAGFEASWSKRAGLVDQMAGFQGMDVLRDETKPGHYVVLTRWATKADFEAWANSPEFQMGHAHSNAGGAGGPAAGGIEFYEVVPSTPTA